MQLATKSSSAIKREASTALCARFPTMKCVKARADLTARNTRIMRITPAIRPHRSASTVGTRPRGKRTWIFRR